MKFCQNFTNFDDFLILLYKISEKDEFLMDLGVRGSQIISEKLPICKYEGYRVGSSRAISGMPPSEVERLG